MTVFEILADVTRRLEEASIPYAVGGSLASSAWGQQRQTNDADIAILVDKISVGKLGPAFPDPYYFNQSEASQCVRIADEFRTVQLLHMEEAFTIDLFLLHGTAYDATMLGRARHLKITAADSGKFCAPEDIVLAKLRWFVLGNRVSDRQWHDIVNVLTIQRDLLDEAYLDKWAEHFGVRDLLDQARAQVKE